MKYFISAILLLLGFSAIAQDYKEQWITIQRLEDSLEIKQAAIAANEIYTIAKRDKNEQQLLKSFFYRAKYMMVIEEDAQAKVIMSLKEDMKSLGIPARALMESLYAEMLGQVYKSNRYTIDKRTNAEKTLQEDFGTWTGHNFRDEITAAYWRSIANRDILYKTPLADYSIIVEIDGELLHTNRPLYDFLMERYLHADLSHEYINEYGGCPQEYLYGKSELFLKCILNDSNNRSIVEKIRLLQETENFYITKNDKYTLQRAVLRRLNYISAHCHFPKKDEMYTNALLSFAEDWGNSPFAYEARYNAAQLYTRSGESDKNKDYYIKAIALCNDIMQNTPHKSLKIKAKNLKAQIEAYQIEFKSEENLLPGKPALVSIRFKNLDSLQVSVYRIPVAIADRVTAKDLAGKKPVLEKVYALQSPKDYRRHSTEIILPALPQGRYAVVAQKPGAVLNTATSFSTLNVSHITAITQQRNTGHYFQIVDKLSGKPVKKARIKSHNKTYTTNKDGKILIPQKKLPENNYNSYIATFKGDTLTGSLYSYWHDDITLPKKKATVTIFTDRSIYRPGQTVYFKAVALLKDKENVKTIPDIYLEVLLENDDEDEIKRLRLKANEFGSVSGEFLIPKNGMTGSYSIRVEEDSEHDIVGDEHPFWDDLSIDFEEGSNSFRVEEYKRPTYEVTFEPVTGDVVFGKEITVVGEAKSFSGTPVAFAKVAWTIKRSSQMAYDNDDGRDVDYFIEGTATTDDNGKFRITFTPAADKRIPEESLPLSTFSIDAVVTDGNGETREGHKSVYAGYHTLVLNVAVPFLMSGDEESKLHLDVTNLNGEKRQIKGKIEIYKFTEDTKSKKRPWASPEIQTITKEEFEKAFPDMNYTEFIPEHEKLFFTRTVNTADSTEVSFSPQEWPRGSYEVVFIAIDSLSREVRSTATFAIQHPKLKYPGIFSYEAVNKDFKKDRNIKIRLKSSKPVLYVNVVAYYRSNLIFDKQIQLKEVAEIDIKLDKDVREAIEIRYQFVYNNEYHDFNQGVAIPDIENKFEIESESITDKLQPGAAQQWKFTIKGNASLPAEVLASMYDASLDKFTGHYWDDLVDRSDYSRNYIPEFQSDFNAKASQYDYQPVIREVVAESGDRIYYFGFNINNPTNLYLNKRPKKQIPKGKSLVISGIVSDETGPLPSATIDLAGTSEGTQTDFDGVYTIYADIGDKISFSYLGMKTKVITADRSYDKLLVQLEADENSLKGVQIDSYRRTAISQSHLAAAAISSDAIDDRANANILTSLQGQLAGMAIGTGSGQPGAGSKILLRGVGTINGNVEPLFIIDGIPVDEANFRNINPNDIATINVLKDAEAVSIYGSRGAQGVIVINTKNGDGGSIAQQDIKAMQNIKARKNFNETAFFKPQLKTDKDGNVSFSFETPEALTQWNLMLLAHNNKGESGYFSKIFTTSKDLMVVPNMPRFLRENDTIILMSKITNLTEGEKTGTALLQLFDAVTLQPADKEMMNLQNAKTFTVGAKSSTTVSWKVAVPYGMQAVQYKVLAKAGDYTDGEENILPVLSNSMLITESIPLWVKPNTTKTYTFENLKNNTSNTLRHHGITLEYTSNPAWAALQSLPYLMEYEHNCTEQIFSRYYANAIAAHIINSNPKIAEVFAEWRKSGKAESKLMQNEELKSALLAETPWALDGMSDAEAKNRLALLFEFDKVKYRIAANLKQLNERQLDNNGLPWFEGGKDNEFITRHVVAGFGHLDKLGVKSPDEDVTGGIIKSAIGYLDKQMAERYHKHKELYSNNKRIAHWSNELHALYSRSFHLKKHPLADSLKTAVNLYLKDIKLNWKQYSLYEKGMAALTLYRFGDTVTSKRIVTALRETSSTNEEWGMYWIENKAGWYWYNAPVETQALLIEAFTEINNDNAAADAMKVWLLKQKQNKNWPTTKATTEAVYALLMKGTDWLSVKENTVIKLGSKDVAPKIAEAGKEAGTGYIKLNWKPAEITKDMGTLTIENKTAVPGYGGLYWQYFEDMDKMKSAQKGILDISREIYRKTITPGGNKLEKATPGNPFKIGELLTIRLIIKAGEDMEFIHLKDLRASAFEPIDVLSGYQWKDGLGFYRSTRDAATHFFFDRIGKGTYVLEYDVRVNNEGDFAGGVSTIQSMYAPEFSGHSKGERVKTRQ